MFQFIQLMLIFVFAFVGKSDPANFLEQDKQIDTYQGGILADQTGVWTDGPDCSNETATILYKVRIPWEWYAPHQALWFKTSSNCNYTVELTRYGVKRRSGMFAKIQR